ncbi:retrovirus-related pol polyprotein from transposon TNT 1-94 [Tanacetum coccineum]
MKGKYVETKFEKPSIIRQPDTFKSQRQSVLGKPDTFSDSLAKKDFSNSKSVTINNVSNDFFKTSQCTDFAIEFEVNFKEHKCDCSRNVQSVISTTSVSRPHLKNNRLEDRVLHNNSEGKKQVEDHLAFWKSTCYISDLKGNDLLTGSHGIDLYSITLQDTSTPNPICLIAKAASSQAWLWHRRLSHLSFDSINLLSNNDIVIGLPKLKFIKDHLCSSFNAVGVKVTTAGAKLMLLVQKLQLLND